MDQGTTPTAPGWHVAFKAPSREAVVAFHAAALAHGGSDDGAPGLRESYGPTYFAAFARDPDGFKVEAVCHTATRPPGRARRAQRGSAQGDPDEPGSP